MTENTASGSDEGPWSNAQELASPEVYAKLARLRRSIDNVDAAVIYMLAERFEFTKQVGQLKAEHALPPSDPGREKQQTARLRELAEQANLDPVFAEKFLNFVVAEVINHHKKLQGDPTPR